ncbi:MAG TPA: TRAP transporter permease [Syntrophales bacterium]|nr:TRAP transporter permease [Syntrophales bacterium]HOX94202.1 TRAP transporter permease [Syntrophales bacterium]HPI57706.1 TRAP transporter permease [Syntrophales bacterium]HPN23939.1 TRAP transporter permease [Syntrophales bacterium]HQM28217.1 TRAP transporter permease [Syntrophales bacterium]
MAEELQKISTEVKDDVDEVAKYDPELRFRKLSGLTLKLVIAMCIVHSVFHVYTAGFGILQEWRHRAYFLAFVLPLVFFLYVMRKDHYEHGTKFLVYDIVFSLIGSVFTTAIFRELFELSFHPSAALAITVFTFLLYFRRRPFVPDAIALYLDLPIFTGMIVSLGYGLFLAGRELDYTLWFKDLNLSLVIWGTLLVASFLGILALFVLQWARAAYSMVKNRAFPYSLNNMPYYDMFFALLASVMSLYIFLEFNSLGMRAGAPDRADLIIGGFSILLVLEGARRSIGPPLPIIAGLILINCYLGPYFLDIPGLTLFAHRGYSISRIVDYMFVGTEGIYGIPIGVIATFVFHFVLFGLFIARTGLGQLFMDLAMALAGWSAGGPAKVAVISSGFFGSISGSSVANTVTTGSFTIPLMKKVGYRPVFAGAVEATSSTGGQIMPPVMGAAAFIMAEFLGIPYIKIATAAIVPALVYYFAVGTMVHLEALKNNLVGLPRHMLPNIFAILKDRGIIVAPLVAIVYLLISGKSPFLSAFWGIILSVSIGQVHRKTLPFLVTILLSVPCILADMNPLAGFAELSPVMMFWVVFLVAGFAYTFFRTDRLTWVLGIFTTGLLSGMLLLGFEPFDAAFWTNTAVVAVGIFYKESKMRIPDILSALEWGTRNALSIGAACACVGFIVGATTLTGLGLKFAATVINLANAAGSAIISIDFFNLLTLQGVTLFFSLVFTMFACFILGMGIPTTAQYIVASMIAAPALLQWGIHPLVSHFFVFYYSILADVTPPVALAAYAASGISGADPFRTGLRAFTLSSGGFIVPFVFVTAPIVLGYPSILDPKVSMDWIWFCQVLFTLITGAIALGATVIGYLADRSTILERFLTGLSAAFLIMPETFTDIAGFALLILVYVIHKLRKRRRQPEIREGPAKQAA